MGGQFSLLLNQKSVSLKEWLMFELLKAWVRLNLQLQLLSSCWLKQNKTLCQMASLAGATKAPATSWVWLLWHLTHRVSSLGLVDGKMQFMAPAEIYLHWKGTAGLVGFVTWTGSSREQRNQSKMEGRHGFPLTDTRLLLAVSSTSCYTSSAALPGRFFRARCVVQFTVLERKARNL